MEKLVQQLKGLGADREKSEYMDKEEKIYVREVKKYIDSLDFMRVGQAVNNKQWQAASVKVGKMSVMAKKLGLVRFERPFTGMRQNINRRNGDEALQCLSTIIATRVKMKELLKDFKETE